MRVISPCRARVRMGTRRHTYARAPVDMALVTGFLRITNGILLVVAVAILGAGGYIISDASSHHEDLPEVPELVEWAGPSLVVLGAGILVVALLGCFAASKSRMSIMLYILLLLCLYTALIVTATGCAFNLSAVSQYVAEWCAEDPENCMTDEGQVDQSDIEDFVVNNLRVAVIAGGALAGFLILSIFAAVATGFKSAHDAGKGDNTQFMYAGGHAGSAMRP